MSVYLIGIFASRLFEGVVPIDEYLDSDQLIMYNLPNVMLSLYVVSSTENWTSILYLAQQCAQNQFTVFCVSFFMIAWFIFSYIVLISIFIAIITENLDVPESEKRRKQIKQFYTKMINNIKNEDQEDGLFETFKRRVVKDRKSGLTSQQMIDKMKLILDDSFDITMLEDEPKQSVWKKMKNGFNNGLNKLPFYSKKQNNTSDDHNGTVASMSSHNNSHDSPDSSQDGTPQVGSSGMLKHKRSHTGETTIDIHPTFDSEVQSIAGPPVENPRRNRVLYLFPTTNKLRRRCQRLVSPPYGIRTEGVQPDVVKKDVFYIIMFLCSVCVVVLTCVATPLYRMTNNLDSTPWSWTTYNDLMFTLIFTAEFVIKN
ncbi:unnamed protein product [Ambrosiozyma monospora]|uniref:Unnamed protein product n=1 Tax=Ambrosiozyma monospora TaxID=43982 RepID=A0ACB5TRU5_AMBMO|nr:unnamed protein product [Ambrosiozyma monospora]